MWGTPIQVPHDGKCEKWDWPEVDLIALRDTSEQAEFSSPYSLELRRARPKFRSGERKARRGGRKKEKSSWLCGWEGEEVPVRQRPAAPGGSNRKVGSRFTTTLS